MKYLFIILALAAVVSCDLQQTPSHASDGSGSLTRYRDEENRVTCWKVRGADGLSCLRDQTQQDQQNQQTRDEDSRGSGDTPAGEQFQRGPVTTSTTLRRQVEAFQL
jgi:hypothetical protein